PSRRLKCPVGLDRDLEAAVVKGGEGGFVELQQRLTACTDDEALAMPVQRWPESADGGGEFIRRAELATVRPDADEVGITEVADRRRAVLLAACPQVAAGETAEHRRPPRVGSLALEGVEDLLDCVSHATV